MDLQRLGAFLVAANQAGYASAESRVTDEVDGSHTIVFECDDWRLEDNFFGGEPYGGREIIAVDSRAEWMMLYYGWVGDTDLTNNAVYGFLRHALMRVPPDKPYRGPDAFSEGDLEYRNRADGGLANFSGEETIRHAGIEVYRARFFGGLIDQRPGD